MRLPALLFVFTDGDGHPNTVTFGDGGSVGVDSD